MRVARCSTRTTITGAALALVTLAVALWWWLPDTLSRLIAPRDALLAALVVTVLLVSRRREQRKTRLQDAASTAARMELSDAMLRMLTVLDSISDGVFVCNSQGRLTLVNPSGW